MEKLLTVSSSPHIRAAVSTQKIMLAVCAALFPAAAFGVYRFGYKALLLIITSMVSAVLFEYLCQKIMKKTITITDGSAALTGLLLALTLPPELPLYMAVFGAFVAIVIAKHSMGGLGYNIFNPALIGRAVLVASWPVDMTRFTPLTADAQTSATALAVLKEEGFTNVVDMFGSNSALYKDMLIGNVNGSIGEVSAILLIIGGVALIAMKYVKWHIPTFMIASVAILSMIAGVDPVFGVLSGGVILGAFFMATDYVTAPMTVKGQIIFAIGAGALTVLIRQVGAYPEGVCYAILLMNVVTPLIDRFTHPRVFGYVKPVKGGK